MEALRRELRVLRALVVCMLAVCSLALIAAARGTWPKRDFDEITVHRIDVIDRENKLAMVLSSHDDAPAPVIQGRAFVREQGNNTDNGIIFFNQKGDEQGGLVWYSSSDRSDSGDTLSFDTAQTDQLIHLENGLEGGKHYADLVGWDRLANENALTIKALDEMKGAHTDAERQAIEKKYETMGLGARRRFFIGYDKDDVSQLELSDGSARPRIKMSVAADGKAKLQFLDRAGRVTYQLPPN